MLGQFSRQARGRDGGCTRAAPTIFMRAVILPSGRLAPLPYRVCGGSPIGLGSLTTSEAEGAVTVGVRVSLREWSQFRGRVSPFLTGLSATVSSG